MKQINKSNNNIKNFINKPFSKHNLETLKILNKLRSANT